MSTNIYKKLSIVQSKLNAPKNQRNTFGGYNYRSAEDILEAVKPLLAEVEAIIVLDDEIVEVANRVYVKATATFIDESKDSFSVNAFAREEETKKGMDASQITGSASSYARKYALNGLLLIDDNKDADATNTHGKQVITTTEVKPKVKTIETRRSGVMKLFANKVDDLEFLLVEIGLLEGLGFNSREEIFKTVETMTGEQIDALKKKIEEHKND